MPTTERLILRAFVLQDANRVQELAGDKRVADTTLLIPHPYPDGAAEEWILKILDKADKGEAYVFAITLKDTEELIGAIGLSIHEKFNSAEMGYWIGVPYWNKGYATEAASAVIEFGFNEMQLNKIHAHHMGNNLSSGKVMIKNGMEKEGYFKKHILKNGEYLDTVFYGILREDYLAKNKK